MVQLESDGTQPFSMNRQAQTECFREKPFFTCYLEGIDTLDLNERSRVPKETPLWDRWFRARDI